MHSKIDVEAAGHGGDSEETDLLAIYLNDHYSGATGWLPDGSVTSGLSLSGVRTGQAAGVSSARPKSSAWP